MKKLKFNPANYNHLDKASLEEWISEFVYRNESFREDFKKVLQMSLNDILNKEEEEFYKKYKVYIPETYILLKDRINIDNKDKIIIVLRPPVYAIRIFDEIEDKDILIKNLEEKRQSLQQNESDEAYIRFTHWAAGLNIKDSNEIATSILGDPDKNGNFMCGDNLLLIVDMNNPQELIEKYIKKILQIHEPKKKIKIRYDKWKYYLIVYDLKIKFDNDISYSEIADQLSEAYPDNKNLFDEKNIENYYKNALELINGGYKKYI